MNPVTATGASAPRTMTADEAVKDFGFGQTNSYIVVDSAVRVAMDMYGLANIAAAGDLVSIQITDPGTPTLDLRGDLMGSYQPALNLVQGNYSLALYGATVADTEQLAWDPHVISFSLTDSGAAIAQGLDWLQSLAATGKISSIYGDASDILNLSLASYSNDQTVLTLMHWGRVYIEDEVSVAEALSLWGRPKIAGLSVITDSVAAILSAQPTLAALGNSAVGKVDIVDSAANINAHLDAIPFVIGSAPVSINLTDSGLPTISVTAAQTNDIALREIKGGFVLSVDASSANAQANGIASDGMVVKLPDVAADYAIGYASGTNDFALVDHGGKATGTDFISGAQVVELQFADSHAFVVNSPLATRLTTGNVTELYAAVLGRQPDIAGLTYYNQFVGQQGVSLSANQLAQYFLLSPEYTGNTAHSYAQSADGDGQFIVDTYQNLLHRTPDTGAVSFYQNLIAQFTNGLTAGTSSYTSAQLQGHAQVLVYFAASQEFLSDVQITAQHPADAQHWLYVI